MLVKLLNNFYHAYITIVLFISQEMRKYLFTPIKDEQIKAFGSGCPDPKWEPDTQSFYLSAFYKKGVNRYMWE
ncbi:MAG: hypothetical protein US50_C0004G0008 [Candidatus Nomurabacteria bacterium GW2011_GWB1_37_5]|uniref:Uncharacterized protein n=1 Tax=Candidatus Nomurabacteria bacterium GW2011_GWB1_37_5 TaxID=1618742 RepID=A0A0G0JG85_9BACT|nr:MAG: hypothetical protein US50_C0004G0008 [Candidatus Nomurabacteria bacterium GW2011_GWB1_37_5]